jgi:hypothetical protein
MHVELEDERRAGIFQQILATLQLILAEETETKRCTCATLAAILRIEKLLTPKPKTLKVKYAKVFSECRCVTYTDKEKIEMSTVIVPVGPNTATVQVLDANGSDITGSCTITAVSSDPTQLAIGNPDATTPNVLPFTAITPGGSVTVDYEAANAQGNVIQTDTIQIEVTAPSSMVITYGATLPATAAQLKAGGSTAKTPVGAKR